MAEPESPLVNEVLTGSNRELKVMAARGLLPLPPEELIPVQVRLARDPDPEVAGRAGAALKATEPKTMAGFVAGAASEEELAYFAVEGTHPEVLEALLRRRDVPRWLLKEVAPRLEPLLQEVLILRQDAILETPEILDALEQNPQLASHVLRRIGEYREHFLRPYEPPEPVVAPPAEEGESPLDDAEVQAAIAEAAALPADGDLDESTGLTESQIRSLPVPVRVKISRGASRTLRGILVRDMNPVVAVSALTHNAFSDEEVEQIARSRSICDDVLSEIGRHREWTCKYNIINALVANPKTPVGIGVRLVPRLGIRDLRSLSHNRNVAEAVRSLAQRTFRVKSQ